MQYPNTTMIIDSGSTNGEHYEFAAWVEKNHPEIVVIVKPLQDGGGGHWDSDGERIDSHLWDDYCRS